MDTKFEIKKHTKSRVIVILAIIIVVGLSFYLLMKYRSNTATQPAESQFKDVTQLAPSAQFEKGEITVKADPAKVNVTISSLDNSGSYERETPFEAELPEGRYLVLAQSENYGVWEKVIEIKKDSPAAIDIKLEYIGPEPQEGAPASDGR